MSTPTTDQSNAIVNETSVHDFMRTFIDYLDDGIHLPALLQVRQLDISLQGKNNIKILCMLMNLLT